MPGPGCDQVDRTGEGIRVSASVGQLGHAGDFRLAAKIGSGGMGEVYLGVSLTAERVAVKVIKPELVSEDIRRRFAQEVEFLRTVYGARVARFAGADLDADPPWLATDYVPGLTLKQYVDQRAPLPAELAAMAAAMLAEGLAMVHETGLLHRDLKPQNVIMGPAGPVLIDFGVATLKEREGGLTEPGHLVGTPAFMAPEQARSVEELTEAVDVYGLGATLVYALTGHPLYPDVGGWALVLRIAEPAYQPDLTGVPAHLESLIAAMLAFDPTTRPTLGEVRARLLRAATAGGEQPEQLRRRLAELTYDETSDLKVDDDPVRDPEATPFNSGPEEPPSPEAPDGREQSKGDTKSQPVRAEVTWLVDRLRKQYARRTNL